jgi:PadR family transcriptional regulator PadR
MPPQLVTDFELMLLLAILRVGEDAYGAQIAREIEGTCGRRVLVSSSVGEPTPERGGRAKRYFKVTPRGLSAARQTQQALVALWRDVPQLKERRT